MKVQAPEIGECTVIQPDCCEKTFGLRSAGRVFELEYEKVVERRVENSPRLLTMREIISIDEPLTNEKVVLGAGDTDPCTAPSARCLAELLERRCPNPIMSRGDIDVKRLSLGAGNGEVKEGSLSGLVIDARVVERRPDIDEANAGPH